MFLIKFIQSLVKALNSEGTPGQVAAGIALGAVFSLTPLMNQHSLALFALAVVLNVSFPGVMLGWAIFLPLGFALDPLFDVVGKALELWMASPAHRDNILFAGFTGLGIGYTGGFAEGHYIAAVFVG